MANEPPKQPMLTSIEGTVLAVKLDHLKEQMVEMTKGMTEMQKTLQMLVRVEEQQRDFRGALDRAFSEIKTERDKLTLLLQEMPSYRALRRWVIGGIIAGMGMMGVALFNLLVIQPLYRGYGQQQPSNNTFIVPSHPEHQQ